VKISEPEITTLKSILTVDFNLRAQPTNYTNKHAKRIKQHCFYLSLRVSAIFGRLREKKWPKMAKNGRNFRGK
jgi:hypothetical protein